MPASFKFGLADGHKYLTLLAAVLLSALGTPVLKALVVYGGQFGTYLQEAISYCNVLFVGNLCSAAIVFTLYGPKTLIRGMRWLSPRGWWTMIANTLFANVLAPSLLILSLEQTDTTAVILLLQTDSVFFALLAWWVFGERPSRQTLGGLGLIGVGVVVLALVQGFSTLGVGFVLAILAAFFRSLGTTMARKTLADQEVLPFFLVFRNLLGAIIFYWLAMWAYGPHHFAQAFLPSLLPFMLAYAGLVVVLGQVAWYQAVSLLPGHVVSKWTTLVPLASMIFAYLLLGTLPTPFQSVSIGLILSGLTIMQLKPSANGWHKTKPPQGEVMERPFTGG